MRSYQTETGIVAPLARANVDTDQILPKQFLTRVERAGFGEFVFYDWRFRADGSPDESFALNQPRYKGASILIAGQNFGCGSSREHAPQALYRWGIRAVIGQSFSEIFFGNALMLGMPCVTAAGPGVRALQQAAGARPDAPIVIDLERLSCAVEGGEPFAIQMPPNAREALVTGAWDATAMLLDDRAAIARTAAALPYIAGF